MAGREVLPAAVVAVGTDAAFEGRAADVAAVHLVEVAAVVRAEALPQERPVDLLDERVQALVPVVDGQPGVGVPGSGYPGAAEQRPRQALAHLGRVVVHRLEVQPCHADDPVVVVTRLHVDLPRPLRRVLRAVAAVDQRERGAGVQHARRARVRYPPLVGRIGAPQGDPRPAGGDHRFLRPHLGRRPAAEADDVHRCAEELLLADRGGPVPVEQPRGRGDRAVLVHQPQHRLPHVRPGLLADPVEQRIELRIRAQGGIVRPGRPVDARRQFARGARRQVVDHDHPAVEEIPELLYVDAVVHGRSSFPSYDSPVSITHRAPR